MIVSSPQGNATNAGVCSVTVMVCTFQVPKGMLQTVGYCHYGKGVAFSFKSPRECYKHLPNTAYLRCPTWFQVPKGMLQTTVIDELLIVEEVVSSPQGNATNQGKKTPFSSSYPCVSSPQGNATNIFLHLYYCCRGLVSSPQGNATNGDEKFRVKCRLATCFKSPRECYKLHFQTSCQFIIYFVSSPQGNATNTNHRYETKHF